MRDWIFTFSAWAAFLFISAVFLWILGDVAMRGAGDFTWEFFTEAPTNAGREGGIAPILVSTGLILLVCMAVTIPIGIFCAIYLAEYTNNKNLFGRFTRRSLDILAGVPSIVFGLFGSVFFCRIMGLGFSILAGGLTLACMVLPILIRLTEEGLRSVPSDYRQAAGALGVTRVSTLFHILLPSAMPGVMVGVALGVGRALAETAALIFTSGYVDRLPESLLDSGRSLSIHIFDLSMNVPGGDGRAYTSALALVMALIVINQGASSIAKGWMKRKISFV